MTAGAAPLPRPITTATGTAAVGGGLDSWLGGHDILALGRAAAAARTAAFGARGFFAVWRQLDAAGGWSGPADAPLTVVDERDLAALGGWTAAQAAGARILLAGADGAVAGAAGATLLLRFGFHHGEAVADRRRRIEAAVATVRRAAVHAVLPVPDGELQSLDALRLFAAFRLELARVGSAVHLAADTLGLGPRLAQMALGFGADEIVAPVVPARALRLGANARNPELTRAEVVRLLRTAGLQACERLADGAVRQEELP